MISPMLASALPEGKTIADYPAAEYVGEQKIDGHRRIIERTATGALCAWSRKGLVHEMPPHLQHALRALGPGTYDGELYVPGGTATDVTALDKQHLLKLALFDLLTVGIVPCMALTGTVRRGLLVYAASNLDPAGAVEVVPQFDPSANTLAAIWAAGLEGVMLKRRSAVYSPGVRSTEWIKFKKFTAAVIQITGFEAGKLGPHSKIIGVDTDGVEVRVKTLNDAWRAQFLAEGEASYIGRMLVIEHQGKTSGGKKYKSAMADHLL